MAKGDDDQSHAARLKSAWDTKDQKKFCVFCVSEAFPLMKPGLVLDTNLSVEDIEDCMHGALETLLKNGFHRKIDNPFAYLKAAARNNANDLHREMSVRQEVSLSGLESSEPDREHFSNTEQGEDFENWSVIAVEEAIDDVEVESHWATSVIQEAFDRLTPTLAKVMRHLSLIPYDLERTDYDVESKAAAKELGMTSASFRQAKKRAYEKLRILIPEIVKERQIPLPNRVAAVFEDNEEFMRD